MHPVNVITSSGLPLTRQMDLNLLELFECIYRTRNLTAAGEQLGLSQPAVSRAVAKLRLTYGDALFIRQQRGVLPTPLAEQLIEPVTQALGIIRGTVTKPTFDPGNDTRQFRVAMSDIGERMFLPQLLTQLAHEAPGVSLEVRSPSRDTLAAEMESGEVDLGVAYIEGLGKAVEVQRLFRERYVHIARTGHPQLGAAGSALTEAQLRGLSHAIAAPPGTLHGAAIERALAVRRIQAHVGLRVKSFLGLGPIVAQTDLVATMPNNLARLVAKNMDLRVYASPLPLRQFDVNMLWHRRFRNDPGVVWLRGVFVSLFGDHPDIPHNPNWK